MEIGQKRNFTFLKEDHQIIDVIKETDFQLEWKWKDIVCPHCKKSIEYKSRHEFDYIEILVPISKFNIKDKLELKKHVIFLGISKDKKILLIPKGYNNHLLKQSEYFKEVTIDNVSIS